MRSVVRIMVGIIVCLGPQAFGQQAPQPQPLQPTVGQASSAGGDQLRPSYVLGPNDQILIRATEVEEISDRPFRVEEDGFVNLPLVGRLRAGGLTIRNFEAVLTESLKKFLREPRVVITVVQYRSEPVFFVGAFQKPGIYPLQGKRTLVEMLTAIGGLTPQASRRLKVTRRTENGKIQLANVYEDPEGKYTSVEISMGSLRENVNPAEDIVLEPFDVITVERAELIYVIGEVGRKGGLELGERESMSVLQVLTMSGGVSPDADTKRVRILRPVLSSSRRAEIQVNITRVLEGKDSDFPILANDVLYVPTNKRGAFLKKAALYAVPIIPTLLFVFLR